MNIELPVANGGASKSTPTSFYQQCNHLVQVIWSLSNHHEINKGMENGYDFSKVLFPLGTENVEGFVYDPVTVLWDFCSLGSPLCAIMNLFKGNEKIKIIEIEPNFPLEITMKKRQKSVYLFIKSCKETLKMTDAELFTITEVFRDDTNYFIKVVKALNKVMDKLKDKEGLPKELIPLPETLGITELNVDESTDYRAKQIKELLETERSYVRDLELMRTYKNEAEFKRVLSKDKALKLFANIDDLVDFQRRFLIGLESTLALPIKEQRIGKWFSTNEDNFSVYDAYCSNQESASEMAVRESGYYTESWSRVYNKFYNLPENTPVNPNNQIPSYLIRPVQRICKYPLLLERLYKHDKKENHPYAEELLEGLEAIKRVVNRTNETKRKVENKNKVEELNLSVEDWKGLQTNQFGELLLTEQFDVSTMNSSEKTLDFYLFERILLSFKEGGKPRKSKVDGKMRVPLILKNNIFTYFITNVEDISIPDQMKFQFKIEFDSDSTNTVILRTKKGLDLVQKWVDEFKNIKNQRNQKQQSAFSSNTQLISNLPLYNSNYAQQFQYDSSEDEYTEEQLNMKKMAKANSNANNGSYTSTLSNSRGRRSSSFNRNESQQDIYSNLSQSYSSTASSSYYGGNEPRNPNFDIYTNNNYYDDSFLDDYLEYDSETEGEYRRGSVSNSSYNNNQYYQNVPNSQYQPHYSSSGQSYSSHNRSNSNHSNQYSIQSSRNSSYPELPTPNFVPQPITLPTEPTRLSNGQYIHQRVNNPQMGQQPSSQRGRERSLSRGSRTPTPMKPSASTGNIHNITNSMNNISISQSYKSLNQITPPVTPIQHVPPIAQTSHQKSSGGHRSFLPGLTLGTTANLKTHFREDTFTLAVPSTSISYEELRKRIEKKLRLCGRIPADFDFNQLNIRYKDELGHHVPINNDDDIFEAFETTFRTIMGKRSSGTMVIELFVH
ncbi:hypothetical protein BCR32DRAFT_272045 [Anaeromyces robustus]|uniref:DH domain-containing protein n=1 Tax=Anaeromyces robustus TaxID=1754192 RepID=A0A1Y1WQ05_9FUNG|nr:hypothetical protein BCR32DRAFT_272045 [Anaeromyces robustus]|eukprot:ORX75204.1 hypothetical protein BCR32DRAFT_272045 [Anaeromyces robustus]